MSNSLRSILSTFAAIIIVMIVFSGKSTAKVYFITDSQGLMSRDYKNNPCLKAGYNLMRCLGKQIPSDFCPSDKSYFKTCVCDPNKYKYDVYNCPYPKILSGDSCHGKFENCGCETKFRYNNENCSTPKKVSGLSCDNNFETCSCDYTYSKTCGLNMVGASESCGGKYKSCKCASPFKTCSEGPDLTASTCKEEDGTLKYSRCSGNSCENGGYINNIPEDYKCSEVSFAGRTCYKDCRPLTCFDGGFYDRDPSANISCPVVEFGKKSCRDCDKLCGYCETFTGKCKIDCKNDCKKGLWFENKLNGSFVCNK